MPKSTWLWQTEARYFQVEVARDLFDDCVVVATYGGRGNKIGGVKTIHVADERAALKRVAQIGRQRARHGYVLVEQV